MKRVVWILALVVGLAVWSSGTVWANGGPHGGYTATTDACAGCHRAHTAQGPRLLTQSSTYNLCMSCHGSTATGADTNVADGVYTNRAGGGEGTVGNPLLGGGFTNYNGAPVTSTHDVMGTVLAAWGNGVDRGQTANLAEGLDCASCHDPHGSPNYRIFHTTINGKTVSVPDYDSATKNYTAENWGGAEISSFCAACHESYHETNANVGSDSAAWTYNYGNGTYTHRVDMPFSYGGNVNPEETGFGGFNLPLADNGTTPNQLVVCTTCHLPHGTSAQMTGFANGVGPAGDSALLRLDNRGVCEVCHQK